MRAAGGISESGAIQKKLYLYQHQAKIMAKEAMASSLQRASHNWRSQRKSKRISSDFIMKNQAKSKQHLNMAKISVMAKNNRVMAAPTTTASSLKIEKRSRNDGSDMYGEEINENRSENDA